MGGNLISGQQPHENSCGKPTTNVKFDDAQNVLMSTSSVEEVLKTLDEEVFKKIAMFLREESSIREMESMCMERKFMKKEEESVEGKVGIIFEEIKWWKEDIFQL